MRNFLRSTSPVDLVPGEVLDRAHLHGIVSLPRDVLGSAEADLAPPSLAPPGTELLRSLAEYEQVTGGGW